MEKRSKYSDQVILSCLLPEDCNWQTGQSENCYDYDIEAFGLTLTDVEVLLASLNAIPPPANGCTPESLKAEVSAAAIESFKDHELFGKDLSYPKHDSPEKPYDYIDLAEKLGRLHPAAAARIEGYVLGYWQGVKDKADERR